MLTDEMRERIVRAVALHRAGKLPDPPPDFPWPQRLHLGELEEMTKVDSGDDKQAAIVRAFEECGSAMAVANHLQIPYETVRRRLHQAGKTLTRGRMPATLKKEMSNV